MIIDHTHKKYKAKREILSIAGQHNGAYYYSQEIVKNIIPNVDTDRNWITVNVRGVGCDHAIVFVHNNLHPEHYEWLKKYDDIVLVCGVKSTVDKVKHISKAIYLPLSIDVDYVEQFKLPADERSGVAFAGRPAKRKASYARLPKGLAILEGLERDELLKRMATFEKIYAVGRTALEAKALGCSIGIYDQRYPKDIWTVLDNKDAAKILQAELDKIDGKAEPEAETPADTDAPSMEWLKADLISYAEANNIYVDQRDTKAMILSKIHGA